MADLKKPQEDLMKDLYIKYGLTKDHVYIQYKKGTTIPMYKIITRAGIDLIQAKSNIQISYTVESITDDLKHVLIRAVGIIPEQNKNKEDKEAPQYRQIISFGEAAPYNTNNSYPVAIAEKRAMARVVLKLAGLYSEGFYSEDESDDFKEKIKNR